MPEETKYSYQIHCAEAMTDERLLRDTVVTVTAGSLSEAVKKAKCLLGAEAERKMVWWPGSVAEILGEGK
jgi:hypothetical protein